VETPPRSALADHLGGCCLALPQRFLETFNGNGETDFAAMA
jgi:hypothetical protein